MLANKFECADGIDNEGWLNLKHSDECVDNSCKPGFAA
jgi:hypothetical protein